MNPIPPKLLEDFNFFIFELDKLKEEKLKEHKVTYHTISIQRTNHSTGSIRFSLQLCFSDEFHRTQILEHREHDNAYATLITFKTLI